MLEQLARDRREGAHGGAARPALEDAHLAHDLAGTGAAERAWPPGMAFSTSTSPAAIRRTARLGSPSRNTTSPASNLTSSTPPSPVAAAPCFQARAVPDAATMSPSGRPGQHGRVIRTAVALVQVERWDDPFGDAALRAAAKWPFRTKDGRRAQDTGTC